MGSFLCYTGLQGKAPSPIRTGHASSQPIRAPISNHAGKKLLTTLRDLLCTGDFSHFVKPIRSLPGYADSQPFWNAGQFQICLELLGGR